MTKGEELIEQAIKMFRENEILYIDSNIDPKLVKWKENGSGEAFYSDGSKIYANTFGFSNTRSQFYYNEQEDMLTNLGYGLGILYYKGVWASRTPYPKVKEIQQTYQIY